MRWLSLIEKVRSAVSDSAGRHRIEDRGLVTNVVDTTGGNAHTFVPGGAWLQPMTILTSRFFKLTAQIDL